MSASGPSFQDVVDLVELIKSSSSFNEMRFRSGDLEIELRRGTGTLPAPPIAGPSVEQTAEPQPTRDPAPAAEPLKLASPPDTPAATIEHKGITINSPMVGTFYRSPEPGAAPFVEPGQEIAAGSTLCIIEVMKLMNTIKAECAGKIVEILVEDAQPVEYGQPLIVIEPR